MNKSKKKGTKLSEEFINPFYIRNEANHWYTLVKGQERGYAPLLFVILNATEDILEVQSINHLGKVTKYTAPPLNNILVKINQEETIMAKSKDSGKIAIEEITFDRRRFEEKPERALR